MNAVQSNKTYTTLFGDHYNNLIVFGNPDVPTEFQNHMKMEFWGENYISFHNEGVKGTPTLDGSRFTLDTPEKIYYWEPKTPNQMKWVEVLKVKPASNKWTLKLAGHKEFNFAYQTPFAIEAQSIPGATVENFKRDGEDWIRLVYPQGGPSICSERPLDIDGSYAVYHKTKRNEIIGHKNYRIGKVLHIPCPKATDVAGKSVLCNLHIENGVYTRTIPQSFLDSAIYPVTINDTFGYWSSGASQLITSTNFLYAAEISPPGSDGSAASVHAYLLINEATDRSVTLGIYAETSSEPAALLKDTAGASYTATTTAWRDQNLDSALAVTNGTNYWIGLKANGSLGWKYDAGSFTQGFDGSAGYSAGNLPNPFGAYTEQNTNRDYSAYVTYTPSDGVNPKGPLGHPLCGALAGPI